MFTLADIQIPKMEIGGNLMIILVIALIVLLRLLISYMRHKQIMAAIEKGVTLSELKHTRRKGLNWIKSISIGIGFLILSLPVFLAFLQPFIRGDYFQTNILLGFGFLFAIGLALFIYGLLQRKTDKAQTQMWASAQINAGKSKNPAGVSTSQILPQSNE